MTESCAIPKYLVERYGPTPLQVKPGEAEWPEYINWRLLRARERPFRVRIAHADATLTFPQTVVLRYTLQEKGRADSAAEELFFCMLLCVCVFFFPCDDLVRLEADVKHFKDSQNISKHFNLI